MFLVDHAGAVVSNYRKKVSKVLFVSTNFSPKAVRIALHKIFMEAFCSVNA